MIHSPTYGNDQWGDLLTAYDGNGLQYDAIGNLTSDGTWTYTWEHGRQLASMTGNGTTWSYTYDADGMRTSRSSGSTTYSYIYNGGQLTQMTVGSNTLLFTYDASGSPQTVIHNGTPYYYVTNLQGDVTAILNDSGDEEVAYTYDAWGNILDTTGDLASTLGALNPLRYRGYVYDQETGLYYLQSRYYNPEIGRFLNADSLVATGQGLLGNNMFAYCQNNPVNCVDPFGYSLLPVPKLSDYYKIHKKVQCLIVENYGYAMEVYVWSPDGMGYLDLFDPVTNQYYEVKHTLQRDTNRTKNQMDRYNKSYIVSDIVSSMLFGYSFSGSPKPGTKSICGTFQYSYWDIGYKLERNGLITYTCVLNKSRYFKTVEGAAFAAAAVLATAAASYCVGKVTKGATSGYVVSQLQPA